MYGCNSWKILAASALTATLFAFPVTATAAPQADPVFELVGTYATGLADPAAELTSGEVAALKGDKLFVSNASDVSVDTSRNLEFVLEAAAMCCYPRYIRRPSARGRFIPRSCAALPFLRAGAPFVTPLTSVGEYRR